MQNKECTVTIKSEEEVVKERKQYKKYVEKYKKKAKEDLADFCIDKSIDLLYGIPILKKDIQSVDVEEQLKILTYLKDLIPYVK